MAAIFALIDGEFPVRTAVSTHFMVAFRISKQTKSSSSSTRLGGIFVFTVLIFLDGCSSKEPSPSSFFLLFTRLFDRLQRISPVVAIGTTRTIVSP
mmetsp:Transcript_96679/g.270618  ORF Transcript_96679/g.270618 Transcript_96679/m.270618 type:complete len:96 (-) Transcript_96679:11-298(-)